MFLQVVVLAILALGIAQTVTSDEPPKSQTTLQLLQIISRHGKRTPYNDSYPSDPNVEFLSLGLGQFTPEGVVDMREYGRNLRLRYHRFIKDDYRTVLARSSPVIRCIQSGQEMLSVLYPRDNQKDEIFSSQPVPISSAPFGFNGALYNNYTHDASDLYKNSTLGLDPEFITTLLKDASEASGVEISLYSALDLYDILHTEKVHRKIIPTRFDKVYSRLEKVNEAFFAEMFRNYSLPMGGALLELLLHDLITPLQTKGTNITTDTLFYFTHDFLITALMGLLRTPMHPPPPFGATIILEKHVSWEAEPRTFIKLLYLNSSTAEPEVLPMDGCDYDQGYDGCRFETFIALATKALEPE